MQTLTLTRPDDAHLHLRDGAALASVLPHTARAFARAVVMPNLGPPVTDTALAAAYRTRILHALPKGSSFEPLMTLYLTDETSAGEIARAKKSGFVCGVKYYPAGATTNSQAGVTRMERVYPALAAMEEQELPLLVHGEVTTPGVDVFDRERVFLDRVPRRRHPPLPAPSHRGRAPDHPRGGAVRVGRRSSYCRHDHRAPPALQPRRDVRRGHPASLLLFAGAEARRAPRGAGARGDERQSEILPRHRQRAACPRRPGDALRARRHLYGARGDRALRGGLRAGRGARQARGFRELPWRGFLPAAAQRGLDHVAQRDLDGARRDPVRRGDARAAARGRNSRVAARLTPALDAPIFAALVPLLRCLPPDRFPRYDELNALATPSVASGGGAPIRFVPPAACAQYETHVFETGEVQTRPDNWHDLFNALVGLAFPRN